VKPKPPKDLWGKMDLIAGLPSEDDEGFTAQEFTEHYRISRSCAAERISKLVAEGKLLQGRRRHTRGFVKVYRPA